MRSHPFPVRALMAGAIAAAFWAAAPAGSALAAEPLWQEPYVGSRPDLLYLPDANAIYWRYGWKRQPGDTGGIVVRGQVPDARYFSYNVYDDDTKATMGSIPDHAVVLEGGAVNPYTGVETDGRGRYTLYIVPEGQRVDAANVLTFPDALTNVSMMLRHYLPRPRTDIQGGAPMPVIEQFDPATATVSQAGPSTGVPSLSMAEAKTYLLPLLQKLGAKVKADPQATLAALQARNGDTPPDLHKIIARQVVAPYIDLYAPGRPVEGYRIPTEGNYPTNDNFYLAQTAVRQGEQAFLTRFRAPGVVRSQADYPVADLRYFSMSQGDENTYNYQTLHDADMTVAADGFIYLMIADDTPALRAKAAELGANFMPWQVRDTLILVYRNMLPRADFAYGIDRVPFYDLSRLPGGQSGRAFIGDFAPVGRMIDEDALLLMSAMPDLG